MADYDKVLADRDAHTEKQVELAYFLQKLDWEGGLEGLIQYGGSTVFPDELKGTVELLEVQLNSFDRQLTDLLAENDIEY